MDNSFQLDDSHSLYLLGQPLSSPLLKRYHSLMNAFAKQGEFLSFDATAEWLSCYQQDAQHLHTKLPLLVFRPFTIASIAPFLRACHEMELAVTSRCGGTGLVGGCVPSKEGILLLTGHFKQIREYNVKDGKVCVEPGVTARQLNQYVEADQWCFPLEMASVGVAGLAGCLSSQARGYHQQQRALFDAIESVTFVDGKGQLLEAPVSLLCGAEGLWGVIIEIKMHLQRKPPDRRKLIYTGSWENIVAKLDILRSIQSLNVVAWLQDKFYLRLEGETWRLDQAVRQLFQSLPGLQVQHVSDNEQISSFFLPTRKPFVVISSSINSLQLSDACQWALKEAMQLQLICRQQADVLAGSLHLILQSEDHPYAFAKKVEQFFVIWTDFIDRQQGFIASCHGIGMQMRPYMTPFWSEETQHQWRKLQLAFDPKELFSKERFFPPFGKSLEKVRRT